MLTSKLLFRLFRNRAKDAVAFVAATPLLRTPVPTRLVAGCLLCSLDWRGLCETIELPWRTLPSTVVRASVAELGSRRCSSPPSSLVSSLKQIHGGKQWLAADGENSGSQQRKKRRGRKMGRHPTPEGDGGRGGM